ncbi:unnamed protein product, partial [Heterotrigona itama]
SFVSNSCALVRTTRRLMKLTTSINGTHQTTNDAFRRFKSLTEKEAILSSGATNLPDIFILSGIKPKEKLNKHGIKIINDLPCIHALNFHFYNNPDLSVEGVEAALKLFDIESFVKNYFRLIDKFLSICRQFEFGGKYFQKCMMMKYTSTTYRCWDLFLEKRLRFYGVDNLGNVAVSIIPKIVKGNTNVLTTTIAKKGEMVVEFG